MTRLAEAALVGRSVEERYVYTVRVMVIITPLWVPGCCDAWLRDVEC